MVTTAPVTVPVTVVLGAVAALVVPVEVAAAVTADREGLAEAEDQAAVAVAVVTVVCQPVKVAEPHRANVYIFMAEPTPWQSAARKPATVRRREVYARDLYNFSGVSVSQGTNNPEVRIPSMGPAAAGAAPYPTLFPTVVATVVTITGSIGPEYGVNSHQPS